MQLLDKIKEEYISLRKNDAIDTLNAARDDYKFIHKPDDLKDYIRYLNAINKLYSRVKAINIEYSITELRSLLEGQYNSLILDYQEKELEINEKYEGLVDEQVESIENEAKEYNKEIVDEFNKSNQIYVDLENKRKELESYSEEVINLCSVYGVTTADITIDNSTFTVEELGSIYDEYINYMKKVKNKSNPISWFRSTFDDVIFQAVVLGIVLLLSFTILLDIIGLVVFITIVSNQVKAKDKMKTYAILLGLIFNIQPMSMGFKDEFDSSSLKQVEVDEDNDERLHNIAEEWENSLEELDKENPEVFRDKEILSLVNNTPTIEKEMNDAVAQFEEEKNKFLSELVDHYRESKEVFEDLKSKVKLLGSEISSSVVFNTKFRLGLSNEVFEEYRDLGMSNLVIRPTEDKEQMRNFLQVLLANAFCNVKENCLTVTVYDPNNFGQDLVGFYHPDLEKVLIFKNSDLDSTITELKEYAMDNMKSMRGANINDYNTEAEKIGKTPKEYKLLIVLSQPKTIEEDEALTEFMAYSANLGVLIWLVTDKDIAKTVVFEKPFDGVQNPYKVDSIKFPTKVSNTLVEAIENSSIGLFKWQDFVDIAVPEKNIWTYIADNTIELDPGFWDGDPTQYKGYTVGNEGDIHALGVGGTGAGKSVFLNHIIMTACRKYAPNTLELWLCDYKGSEFKLYLPNEKHPYMLPHVKACLCTSDGDYAGSLYAALRKVAEERYDLLGQVGYTNIKDYNQHLRETGRESEIIRRILFINDEFQVIFEKAEPKIIEQINKDITYISKVARAAGIHLFFLSQSMKKTISVDTLQQFSLRFGLRCVEEVSMSVLGTKYASEIKQKNGYLYVRSVDDVSLKAQKRYRTPFISNTVIREQVKKLAERAEIENMPKHSVITYEEKTIHSVTEINKFYSSNSRTIPDYGLILLGNRMTYSENKAPDNVVLQAVNNSHIISAFSDNADLVNFYKSIICNIENWRVKPQMLWNSQIADLHYICELDKDVPEELQELSHEKNSIYDLQDLFYSIYENRVSSKCKEEPLFIFLIGWDKAVGFGIDKDSVYVSKFAKLLQVCGEYNMHFIFINTAIGGIASSIVTACRNRIAGKCDEATSFALLNSKQGAKSSAIKNGYMYFCRGGEVTRAKIYQSSLKREVKKSELIL